MKTEKLPLEFQQRIQSTYGAEGAEWLEALPALLRELAERWSLALQPPFECMAYNYVAPATDGQGTMVVLKVGVPNPELFTEIEALRVFNGEGCVRLLASSVERGAMLLERLLPGEPLTNREDRQATEIACEVMAKLWKTEFPHSSFPTVGKWGAGFQKLRARFQGGTGPFPEGLVEPAERRFHELLDTMDDPVLLHGDLHHSNILSATRAPWLAVDPKGVVGEPAYEVGSWIRNPYPDVLEHGHFKTLLQRRIMQFSKSFGFPQSRLYGWAFSQAVLSAWWSYEDDHKDWKRGLALAEMLYEADSSRGFG